MKIYLHSLVLFFIFLALSVQAEWKERNNGLPSSWAPACCLSAIGEETAIIGIYNHPKSQIWLTTNAGLNWIEISTPEEVSDLNIIDIAMIDTNKIWICTAESPDSARIFATFDGGATWEKQFENPETTTFFNYIEMFDADNGVAMGDAVENQPALFLQTTDGGENWIVVNEQYLLGGFSGQTWARIDFATSQCGYFFASGVSPNRLYKTTDNGVTWTPTNLNNYFGAVVKFYDENYGIYVENDGTIFRTTNGFDNRTRVSAPADAWPSDVEFLKGDGSKVYISYGSQLFFSNDSGITWESQLMPLDFSGRDIEFTDDKHGWILTPNSVYYTSDGGMVTMIGDQAEVVARFHLNQNYPNPFNPITAISYQLSAASDVELSIFNLVGQKVATLVMEEQSAGVYEVIWDATEYSSGVYFYHLTAGKFQDVKKMILMK